MLDSTTQDQFSIHIMVVLMRNGMNAVRSLLLSYTMLKSHETEFLNIYM